MAGFVAACSTSSPEAQPAAATPLPDSGSCRSSACCTLPEPGSACTSPAPASTTGSTFETVERCSYAVRCPEGLVLARTVACQSGRWTALSDCPAAGQVDVRGCPGSQPTAETPCALDGGSSGPCGYSKTCDAKVCDGGDCRNVHQSAQATCIQGVWKTTPLGPC